MAFSVTNAGNTFGYAWCSDEDGRTRLEQASVNGCADRQGECLALETFEPPRFSDLDRGHSAPCSDVLIDKDGAVVAKRILKHLKLPMTGNAQGLSFKNLDTQALQFVSTPASNRVPLAILAHRTVVLLN